MVDGAATVGRSTVFADVLDAPVAELAMGDHIDASQNLIDAWTLMCVSTCSYER